MTDPSIAAAPHGSIMEIAGQEIVRTYGNVHGEYEALHRDAIVIDRSHRGRLRFFGKTSGEALTGLVTNDVLAMQPGHGQYGVALSPKGRITADLRIFAGAESYLVDTSPRAWPGWLAMVKKYVNPRMSSYRDESHTLRDIGVFGVQAQRIVAEMTGLNPDALAALVPYAHVDTTIDGVPVTIARSPDIAIGGYDLFVPFDAFDALWDRATAAGAAPAGLDVWEIARVEAGRPEWGLDIDANTIPQEANLDDLNAISYTKGCYIGQEVVARVHFRGHVNRHLRGIRAASVDGPPMDAQLIDDSGNHVGDVRSSVQSPRLGGIALAMVRREITPGMSLNAKWEQGERRVDVVTLPFPA